MIDNLLIFQTTVGLRDVDVTSHQEVLNDIHGKVYDQLQQGGYIVKNITVPDYNKSSVEVKLVYPIYNLIDKDAYEKHIELHGEIEKIKRELELS